ncbi:hypothetical protein BKI52_11110 [marine bacterium AO1-C]|nr:hypothetical protein BKI52_11110 [marine bacterium AO1-C]
MNLAILDWKTWLERDKPLEQKREDHLKIIDQLYADDIVQVENGHEEIHGKANLRAIESANLDKVNWVKTKIEHLVFDDTKDMLWAELRVDFETKEGARKVLLESVFQHWEDGKIKVQKFYYGKLKTIEE